MTKQELRKFYLQKRLQLSESEHEILSQQICNHFFSSFDLSHIKVIHVFLPIKKNKEPNTWFIIDRLAIDFPSIKISIPKVVNENLVNYFLDSDCLLEENKWGIQEPVNGNITDVKDIDLVLVPLLAFDNGGHRVGYGKGYYDRFLISCRADCSRIGISLFPPIDEIKEVSSIDIELTFCLHPFGVTNFL